MIPSLIVFIGLIYCASAQIGNFLPGQFGGGTGFGGIGGLGGGGGIGQAGALIRSGAQIVPVPVPFPVPFDAGRGRGGPVVVRAIRRGGGVRRGGGGFGGGGLLGLLGALLILSALFPMLFMGLGANAAAAPAAAAPMVQTIPAGGTLVTFNQPAAAATGGILGGMG